MALTLALRLNVKLRDFLFDTPLQNMNRTGTLLSIIYTLSSCFSCLSALVAVTCPDTNGGWKHLSVFQQGPLKLCTIFFQQNIPETTAMAFSAAIRESLWGCLVESQHPWRGFCCCTVDKYRQKHFYSHFGVYHAVLLFCRIPGI